MTKDTQTITSVLKELRQFAPDASFSQKAHVGSLEAYRAQYQESIRSPEAYWGKKARELLTWDKPFQTTLTWEPPVAKWFEDGALNVSANCLDRHVKNGLGQKVALHWEGEPGDSRRFTYAELHEAVAKAATMLKNSGVTAGDRVVIYMPLIPEVIIAMQACARIGAIHSVVFGGFSAEALRDRINDSAAKLVITADGGWRRGQTVGLKDNVDLAMRETKTVEQVIVVQRTKQPVTMGPKDKWWHDLFAPAAALWEAPHFPAEQPLFMLYTSGSTGKPKGIVHTSAGYLLGAMATTRDVFDLKSDDVFWCTADVGWVTGHTYVCYGPLANGATMLIYEGAPNFPDIDRFWQLVDKYQVSIFYTAPTAIRSFMKWGDAPVKKHSLASLRLLGSVGEPINPEAWLWYRDVIGKSRCPIVDTWWQTETGGIMITPLPGATPTIPGTATLPYFGVEADVVDKNGHSVPANTGGYLVIRKPWPFMARTIYGDPERYFKTYWEHFPGIYFTGDGARRDEHGNFWIMGRIDDVLNVSGHRLSTMEVESALVSHAAVAEAAVVGKPDPVKGEGIVAFVTLKAGQKPGEPLGTELTQHVAKVIGALARPDEVRFAEVLPKTRSGKIMRRLLRDIAAGRASSGDMSTLEDFSVLAKLREDEE